MSWEIVAVDTLSGSVTVAFAGTDHRISVDVPPGLTKEGMLAFVGAVADACEQKRSQGARSELLTLLPVREGNSAPADGGARGS